MKQSIEDFIGNTAPSIKTKEVVHINVQIAGPRGCGKSILLRKIATILHQEGYSGDYVVNGIREELSAFKLV